MQDPFQTLTGQWAVTALPSSPETAGTHGVAAQRAAPMASAAAASPVITLGPETTAAQLQQLINTAAAGTTIRLAAGEYHFSTTIEIARDDISVVGAGSGATIIHVPPTLNQEAFAVGTGVRSGSFTLAADAAEGSTALTLTGAHSFQAGDYVYLERANTTAFFNDIKDYQWREVDNPLRTSIVQVLSVNGNTITLAGGVHFDFTKGETVIREIDMAERVTLGGISVDYGLAAADPSDFSNTLPAYDRNAVIDVEGTAGLTLYDIAALDVPSLGLNVALSTHADVDGMHFTGSHNKGDAGNGYGYQLRDVYDSAFTHLSDLDMRHSVLFASWRSAVGNFVHVSSTDRDINFHGGRHHDNTVVVDNSIRDANSDIIAPTLFINIDGTSYGAPTDPTANLVRFGTVVGSRLDDVITGYDTGSWLNGAGGNDRLTGGAGNDLLVGAAGRDALIGGLGEDIAGFSDTRASYLLTAQGSGNYTISQRGGTHEADTLTGVEWLLFSDGALRLSDMSFQPVSAVDAIFQGVTPYAFPETPPALQGTEGKDTFNVTVAGTTVAGLGDWDSVSAWVSFTMADDVERLELMGTAAINGTGSARADLMLGNDAANILQGLLGNDTLFGRGGADTLTGGAGADVISGGDGNDLINGGAGRDTLTGDAGADVFVFGLTADSGPPRGDTITDFTSGIDRINLQKIDANQAINGNQAFVWGTGQGGNLWVADGYLQGDTNGDGGADVLIWLGNVPAVAGDVIL